jgi:hypothetical protein
MDKLSELQNIIFNNKENLSDDDFLNAMNNLQSLYSPLKGIENKNEDNEYEDEDEDEYEDDDEDDDKNDDIFSKVCINEVQELLEEKYRLNRIIIMTIEEVLDSKTRNYFAPYKFLKKTFFNKETGIFKDDTILQHAALAKYRHVKKYDHLHQLTIDQFIFFCREYNITHVDQLNKIDMTRCYSEENFDTIIQYTVDYIKDSILPEYN